jgi:hypothetical protein
MLNSWRVGRCAARIIAWLDQPASSCPECRITLPSSARAHVEGRDDALVEVLPLLTMAGDWLACLPLRPGFLTA